MLHLDGSGTLLLVTTQWHLPVDPAAPTVSVVPRLALAQTCTVTKPPDCPLNCHLTNSSGYFYVPGTRWRQGGTNE